MPFRNVLVGADPRVRPGADTCVGPYAEVFERVSAYRFCLIATTSFSPRIMIVPSEMAGVAMTT